MDVIAVADPAAVVAAVTSSLTAIGNIYLFKRGNDSLDKLTKALSTQSKQQRKTFSDLSRLYEQTLQQQGQLIQAVVANQNRPRGTE